MKTEFMNSMCHEIRTPLNATVVFLGICVDSSYIGGARFIITLPVSYKNEHHMI